MPKSNLTIDNRLSLTGFVASHPKRSSSPSGIEHCRFVFEHRSQQTEAGLVRQAWCKIAVSLSGQQLIKQTQSITVGSKLLIVGFITTHKSNNGLSQLVLHAEQIEFID
ncbi:primosomal replication protein N [Testudinibacter sp. TR-2022]|uniref:primosomal replication protein N n=1 Tax=Testudinibacter sp. TR-2022 TaxID=2585029 RepID=UPI00111ABF63|nr:primosomal replication protein N [Testudinibacter sp. TR-2022]TNH03966.1 primosomal replication protein N [Pasteurellaceae bacterium Phil31]TNH09579.1 primosomal replication protein N [Testudinibacter sp. TR-2022]TNH10063.1 primosomal replication protein N [Testudinibacter sp. TR-2022]TNH13179.1 primosomal replication protein N [Testudinibacter sp. TR-2022]TNH13893.1 primosomal replication protein N [Testudinibacter sp. TR-2022]